MRCTTELTSRFQIASTNIGSLELKSFLDNDDSEVGTVGYWEAFEQEEQIRLRGEDGLLDALDFVTVTFDSVENELSMELYEMDCEADRVDASHHCVCTKCGRDESYMEEFKTVAGKLFCETCKVTDREYAKLLIELEIRRERRQRKAERFNAALEKAKLIAPDLNWAQYTYDTRRNGW